MGACSNSAIFKVFSQEMASKKVKEMYEQDLVENGNDSYSGSWGSNHGFKFFDKKYSTLKEAEEFAENNASKGDEILCISFYEEIKDTKVNTFNTSIISLKEEIKQFLTKCLDDRKSKRKTATCVHCGDAKTLIANVFVSHKCPKCNKEHFYLSQTEFKKLEVLKTRLSKIENDKKLYVKKVSSKNDLTSLQNQVKTIKTKISTLKNEIEKSKNSVDFCTCSHCNSKINMKTIRNSYKYRNQTSITCPVCEVNTLGNKSDIEKSKKIYVLEQELEKMDKELSTKSGICWYVYALSRC